MGEESLGDWRDTSLGDGKAGRPNALHDALPTFLTSEVYPPGPVFCALVTETADVDPEVERIRGLSQEQIRRLSRQDIRALTAYQIQALSTAQIQALTPEQIAAFSVQQIRDLSNEQMRGFTASQIDHLSREVIEGLGHNQRRILFETRFPNAADRRPVERLASAIRSLVNGDGQFTEQSQAELRAAVFAFERAGGNGGNFVNGLLASAGSNLRLSRPNEAVDDQLIYGFDIYQIGQRQPVFQFYGYDRYRDRR